jgi:hypothetical protein
MIVNTNPGNLDSRKQCKAKINKEPEPQISFRGNDPEVFRIWDDHGHSTSAYHGFSWGGFRVTPDDISKSFDYRKVIDEPVNDEERKLSEELNGLFQKIGFKNIKEKGSIDYQGVLLSNLVGIETLNNNQPGMLPVQEIK